MMQIALPGSIVSLPHAPSEDTDPIVGWRTIRLAVTPEIPIALGIVSRRSRLLKPRMVARGVIGNPIENHFQIAAMGLDNEGVEGLERAEPGLNITEVRDVVANVLQG